MTRSEIKDAFAEINKEGSDLNAQYNRWRKQKMTGLIGDILQFLANPDQTIRTVPTIGEQEACSILGYVSGRSQCAADMMELDNLIQTPPDEVPETYGNEEEGQ